MIELNDHIKRGIPFISSKKCDIIPKVAVSLHTLESIFKILRNEMQTISEEISIDTLKNASMLVESLDDQKHYFKTVINDFCFTVLRDFV